MYTSLAQLGLVLSILAAFLLPLGFFWIYPLSKNNFRKLLDQIVVTQFIFISFAFIALSYAYMSSDFALLNVFRNSHTAMPILYKFSGLWSNHEGSMLLWVFLLSLSNIIFMQHNISPKERIWIASIQIILTSSLLSYVVLKSNPFIRLSPIPTQGMGFNPLLQDIGLAIHPPILYIGYITTAISFSIACAALVQKKLTAGLIRLMQLWNLFSWSFLTIGVALGSWWAYRELGWGGYWFWDPVENASLLPWLISLALAHSIYVTKKLDTNYKGTILLALLGFLLSILATFLVRSGAVTSVHSFASDPDRGIFILNLLVSYSIASLGLFAVRAHKFNSSIENNWISRYGGINLGNILWCFATIVILFSLLYPIILELSTGAQIVIEPNFFEKSFIPLVLGVLFFLAVALPTTWQKILWIHWRHFIYSCFIAIAFSGCFYYYASAVPSLISLSAFFVGLLVVVRMIFWIACRSNLTTKFYAIWLVHLLAGLLAMTIAFLETNSKESLVNLKEGEMVKFADFTLTFAKKENLAVDNYLVGRAILYLEQGNYELATLTPEVHYYPVEKSQTTEASVYHNIFYDLYAVINEANKDGDISLKLYLKPLISWIWGICLVSFACGILLLILNIRKKPNASA